MNAKKKSLLLYKMPISFSPISGSCSLLPWQRPSGWHCQPVGCGQRLPSYSYRRREPKINSDEKRTRMCKRAVETAPEASGCDRIYLMREIWFKKCCVFHAKRKWMYNSECLCLCLLGCLIFNLTIPGCHFTRKGCREKMGRGRDAL